MKILAIETSCDETAISILDCTEKTVHILSHNVHSQIEMHKEFGGVYPNLARREHQKNLFPILLKSLKESNVLKPKNQPSLYTFIKSFKLKSICKREPELFNYLKDELPKIQRPEIDAIAVTEGPGLEPALWVGITFAKALSHYWNIPIIPVNHMEGHIVSALLENGKEEKEKIISDIEFPAIALLISGGHTELVKVNKIGDYEILGQTRDDAVGEAFDKVARLMKLPYPGGPQISALAESARSQCPSVSNPCPSVTYRLPRPMINSGDLDFSFSGIKTAVKYMIEKIPEMTDEIKMQIAKEFEDAVIDVLISKTKTAIEKIDAKTLIVGGGVISNKTLRERLNLEIENVKILVPEQYLTGDNATMIGITAYLKGKSLKMAQNKDIIARGALKLDKSI